MPSATPAAAFIVQFEKNGLLQSSGNMMKEFATTIDATWVRTRFLLTHAGSNAFAFRI
jgi:hypothetical protein